MCNQNVTWGGESDAGRIYEAEGVFSITFKRSDTTSFGNEAVRMCLVTYVLQSLVVF